MMASAFCAASMACEILYLLPSILAVGDQHEDLASHLSLELIGGCHVDGVVQNSPARLRNGRYRAWTEPAHAGTHLQPIQAGAQELGRVGVILQQLGVFAEADQKRQVLLAQYRSEELISCVLLDFDQVLWLALTSMSNPMVSGRSVSRLKELDLLFLAVLENLEVVLVQIADQPALLVANVEQDVDQADLHLQGGIVLGEQERGKRCSGGQRGNQNQGSGAHRNYIGRCTVSESRSNA